MWRQDTCIKNGFEYEHMCLGMGDVQRSNGQLSRVILVPQAFYAYSGAAGTPLTAVVFLAPDKYFSTVIASPW